MLSSARLSKNYKHIIYVQIKNKKELIFFNKLKSDCYTMTKIVTDGIQ